MYMYEKHERTVSLALYQYQTRKINDNTSAAFFQKILSHYIFFFIYRSSTDNDYLAVFTVLRLLLIILVLPSLIILMVIVLIKVRKVNTLTYFFQNKTSVRYTPNHNKG